MEILPNFQLGFYQPDLKIEYMEASNESLPPINNLNKEFYHIVYIFSGTYEIITNNSRQIVEKGATVISNHISSFGYRRKSNEGKLLIIDFQASTLGNTDFDFLRVFYNMPCGSCFYPATFKNLVCFEILNSMKDSLEEKRNRFYIVNKLKVIIGELDFKYDELSQSETYDKSNTTLSVIEFVKNNYTQNITLESLRKKFFISNSTINRMFINVTGKTFKVFINDLRLENIKNLLLNEDYNYINISKIAEIGGYKTYSTFYREFVKKYGIAPTEIERNGERTIWPIK